MGSRICSRSSSAITATTVEQRNVLKERVGLKHRRDGVRHVEDRQLGLVAAARRVSPTRHILWCRLLLLLLLDIGAGAAAVALGGQIEAKLEHTC